MAPGNIGQSPSALSAPGLVQDTPKPRSPRGRKAPIRPLVEELPYAPELPSLQPPQEEEEEVIRRESDILSSSELLQQLQDLHFVGGEQLLARYGVNAVSWVMEQVTEPAERLVTDTIGYVRRQPGRKLRPGVRSVGLIRWLLQQEAQP